MNKLIIPFLFVVCLLMASCDSSDEPEPAVYPIRFNQSDYTIRYATTARIGFVDGGGIYELTASNPEVLGDFYIDAENSVLVVRPSSVGESTLTVTDVEMDASVILKFTVEDFYLSFRVAEIEGDNHNPYLSEGNEIRFIRDDENTRQMKVMWQNKVTYELECIAYGRFDIERSEPNIYTLNMALHSQHMEELEAFSYTISGDWECLAIFEKYFEYEWDDRVASKSLPPKVVKMVLTDPLNDAKITCSLQPF